MSRTHAHRPARPAKLAALSLGLLLVAALGLGLAACSSSNPVEPPPDGGAGGGGAGGGGGGGGGGSAGTYQIALTVTPQQVDVGGSATLSVEVTSKTTGQAPANGSEVTLNTDLGYFSLDATGSPVQQATVRLVGGAGQASFFGGDSTGTASLLALFDDSTAGLAVTISEPGEPPFFVGGVSPDVGSGQGGQLVTVTGTGFTQPLQVTFGGAVGTVQSVAAGQISVRTPPAVPALASGESRRVDVVVSIDVDTSEPRTSTLPGGYIYSQGGGPFNVPAIFSIDPTSGPNTPGIAATITGQGFEDDARVYFGFSDSGGGFDGVEATVDHGSSSDTLLALTTPAATGTGQILLNQTVDVQVENPRTGLTAVLTKAFRYGAPDGGGELRVSAISPRQAPYTGFRAADDPVTVTLLGQGFGAKDNNDLTVTLAGVAQSDVTVAGGSELSFPLAEATVSACAPPSGPAVVTNTVTGESAQTDFDFSYTVEAPRLTGVSPASATAGAGTVSATLSGRALVGPGKASEPVRVTFDGVRGVVSSVSSTGVVVQVPAFTGSYATEACDDNGDGVAGTRDVATAVDVAFTNLTTGCADTLPRAFTYVPADTDCEETDRPDADFTFTTQDLMVSFTDTSSGSPVDWSWDFGDGVGSSSEENPTYTYLEAGSYPVTLQVTNEAGIQDEETKTVVVSEPPP